MLTASLVCVAKIIAVRSGILSNLAEAVEKALVPSIILNHRASVTLSTHSLAAEEPVTVPTILRAIDLRPSTR
jgi:hypothetical protein